MGDEDDGRAAVLDARDQTLLVRRGLLLSQQGTRGGYQLARAAAAFVLGDIIEDISMVAHAIQSVVKSTEKYQDRHLILALSYGSRMEITEAVRQIAGRVKSGDLALADIDEATVSQNLYLPDVPDPDLIIRTSGEMRLSNFLLWQASYSEFYVTDILWPDFREEDFAKALEAYGKRHRRFGNIG